MSAETSQAERAPVLPMYRALVGIGLLSGLLVAGVYEVTRPIIEANRAELLERAIFEVLPAASSRQSFAMGPAGDFSALEAGARSERVVHAGYDDEGELIGLAIEAKGMGYQDVIQILYGYSLSEQAVVGMRVLDSRETPGLGDKIETDPLFLENFERLDVSLDAEGAALAHGIESVKRGEKEAPWQIDAITGATISSNAIASILDRSASFWMPRVAGARASFVTEEEGR